MHVLTAHDYDLDEYQEDDMNARGLRFQVSPAIQALAERLRQPEPPFQQRERFFPVSGEEEA